MISTSIPDAASSSAASSAVFTMRPIATIVTSARPPEPSRTMFASPNGIA
jgi:hypothetical protein